MGLHPFTGLASPLNRAGRDRSELSRLHAALFLVGLVGLIAGLAGFALAERTGAEDQAKINTSRLLVNELRDSSNSLTRSARTYVVTGDERFVEYFNLVLATRDGQVSRQFDYLDRYGAPAAIGRSIVSTGETRALLDLLADTEPTPEERRHLAKAKALSDQLTSVEREAIALAADGQPSDRDIAIDMVFDEPYREAKADLLNEMGLAEKSIDERSNAASLTTRARLWAATAVGVVSSIILIVSGGAVAASLRRQRDELDDTRRHLEERVEERTAELAQYGRVIEASPMSVALLDPDLRYLVANRLYESTLGVVPGDSVVGGIATETQGAALFRNHFAAGVQQVLAGESIQFRKWIDDRDTGEPLLLDVRCAPTLSPDGRVTGVIVQANDITELKALQDRLAERARLESIGVLAAGVAHRVNNALTVIVASADLLITDLSPIAVEKRLELIYSAAHDAGEVTDQLLAFSQLQPTRPEPVTVAEVIDAALELFATAVDISVPAIHRSGDEDLVVMGDRRQLPQALSGLLINAFEAAGPGGTVSVRTETVPDEPAMCAITVADDGPGFPLEHAGRLFEPFFTTKNAALGAGLGLAVADGIMKAHGGRVELGIGAENGGNGGATVSLVIPTPTPGTKP